MGLIHTVHFLFATVMYFIAWNELCRGLCNCSYGATGWHFCVQCVTSHLNRLHTHFYHCDCAVMQSHIAPLLIQLKCCKINKSYLDDINLS